MKIINSSYTTSLADCYDVVTWASHCKSRNGAHWYNQDQEAMFLGKLFTSKADVRNFPSNSLNTSMWCGRILCWCCSFFIEHSHLGAGIWLQSWFSLFLPHSVKTMKYSYLPIASGMTSSTKFEGRSTLLAARMTGAPSCLTFPVYITLTKGSSAK